MAYLPEPPYAHGSPSRPGVLLVNLGTPDEPTPAAVRRYLAEFLWDPRVVEIPRAAWWLILRIILLTRPAKSAAKYAAIWTKDGSPLRVHLGRQVQLLRGYLGERLKTPLAVAGACRYGNPSVAAGLAELRGKGCDRILVIPLYPQYAASTTGFGDRRAGRGAGRDAQRPRDPDRAALPRPPRLREGHRPGRQRLLDEARPAGPPGDELPRPAPLLPGPGRPLPLRVPQERAPHRHRAGLERRAHAGHLPVALRPRRVAQALHGRHARGTRRAGRRAAST